MPIREPSVPQALTEYFGSRRPELAAAYLFGSLARRTAGESSDVDLGLLFREAPEPGISGPAARIEDDLEHRLGRPVQAIVMNTAPPDLVHRILRDGRIVHEADRSARVRFEVAARREYLDLLPVLRQYRRSGAGAA